MCHKSRGHVKTCNENVFQIVMGVRCDGSVAGGNARSTFPYVYLPLGAHELRTSVNGSLNISQSHFFS